MKQTWLTLLFAALLAVPARAEIKWGVNGHEGRSEYAASTMEQRMQLLQANNLKTYRTDVGTSSTAVMDKLVPLADRYGIKLRPMLYPDTEAATFDFVSRYPTVEVWEIGNEQDGSKRGAQARIDAMMNSYRAVKRAGKKTSINITACNNDGFSQCAGDPNGNIWFLDMAKAAGFDFDYVTFHYYPRFRDKGYWYDKYLSQMRKAATKYKVPIFLNEINCGEIYDGNTDGGRQGDKACYDGLKQFFETIRDQYADIVQEISVYELLDEPRSAPAGVERHFGLAYDMNRTKPTWTLLTTFSTASAPPPLK